MPVVAGLITLVAILVLTSRGSGSATPRPTATSPPERDTAAGAQVAAQQVFGLYGAGQYSAVYTDLVPAIRSVVPESTWVAVQQRCRPTAAGPAFTVASLDLTDQTAVVTLSLGPVSQTQVLDYVAGKWLWAPSGQDLAAYQGSVAQIVSRLKSDGFCTG